MLVKSNKTHRKEDKMSARERMRQLFVEVRALENPTTEQKEDMRAKTKPIIEAACREQHRKNGSVFPPTYCLACMGCSIGTIVEGIARP